MGAFNELIIESLGSNLEWEGFENEEPTEEADEQQLVLVETN